MTPHIWVEAVGASLFICLRLWGTSCLALTLLAPIFDFEHSVLIHPSFSMNTSQIFRPSVDRPKQLLTSALALVRGTTSIFSTSLTKLKLISQFQSCHSIDASLFGWLDFGIGHLLKSDFLTVTDIFYRKYLLCLDWQKIQDVSVWQLFLLSSLVVICCLMSFTYDEYDMGEHTI